MVLAWGHVGMFGYILRVEGVEVARGYPKYIERDFSCWSSTSPGFRAGSFDCVSW